MDTSKKKQRSLGDSIIRFLGFYRNPVYIEDQLKEADVRSAVYLTAIVSVIEIFMLLRYVKNWVLPGKVASVGEFFHYTSTYWWFLAASLLLLVYCSLFLKKKLKYLGKYSREIIFAYFLLAMYFGVTLSMHDFSRGRMILCFLTMLMYVTIICVWRPYTSILLIVVFGGGFIWLLNNYTYDKAGNPLKLSEGDYINFVTTLVTMFILVVAVYHQRYRDATKSWELGRITVTDDLTGISNMHNFEQVSLTYLAESLAQGKNPVYLTFNLDLRGWAFVIFFGVMYFLYSITYTMHDIAYWGMVPALSSDADTRNQYTSRATLFAGIGGVLASPVDPRTGMFNGLNCHGPEKVRRFREVYPEAAVENFYSDSRSDTPMAEIAQKAWMVRGERMVNWELGIGNWE